MTAAFCMFRFLMRIMMKLRSARCPATGCMMGLCLCVCLLCAFLGCVLCAPCKILVLSGCLAATLRCRLPCICTATLAASLCCRLPCTCIATLAAVLRGRLPCTCTATLAASLRGRLPCTCAAALAASLCCGLPCTCAAILAVVLCCRLPCTGTTSLAVFLYRVLTASYFLALCALHGVVAVFHMFIVAVLITSFRIIFSVISVFFVHNDDLLSVLLFLTL